MAFPCLHVMKNSNQIALIGSASACRAKAAALRESARSDSNAVLAAKLLVIAQQWDDLAADYDASCLKPVE